MLNSKFGTISVKQACLGYTLAEINGGWGRWERRWVWSTCGSILGIIGGNCHKYHFCRDKSLVVTNTCLSRQSTSFVATKECLFCRDKHVFICHDILLFFLQVFVATKKRRRYLWQLPPTTSWSPPSVAWRLWSTFDLAVIGLHNPSRHQISETRMTAC